MRPQKRTADLKTMRFALLALGLTAGFIAAEAAETRSAAPVQPATARKPAFGAWGVDVSAMDLKARPGDDFFQYTNGDWYGKAVIPVDRGSTGSFVDLGIQSEDRIRAIVTGLQSRSGPLTADEQRVRDLYHSYVDTDRIEQLGLAPATPVLDQIAKLQTSEDVASAMGSVGTGIKSLFRTNVGIDDKKPDSYAVFLGQAGLGLPDRDYYLLNDKTITAARDGYRVYIAKIFDLAGIPGGTDKAGKFWISRPQSQNWSGRGPSAETPIKFTTRCRSRNWSNRRPGSRGEPTWRRVEFPARRKERGVSLSEKIRPFRRLRRCSQRRRCKPGRLSDIPLPVGPRL